MTLLQRRPGYGFARKINGPGDSGALVRSTPDVGCCCTTLPTSYQLRKCSDDTLADVWSTSVGVGETVIRHSNFLCYYRQAGDPESTTPGTDIGAYTLVSGCGDSRCDTCADCPEGAPPNITISFDMTWCANCADAGFRPAESLGTYTVPRVLACVWDYDTSAAVLDMEFPPGCTVTPNASNVRVRIARENNDSWNVTVTGMTGAYTFFSGRSPPDQDCSSPIVIDADANVCGTSAYPWVSGTCTLTPTI